MKLRIKTLSLKRLSLVAATGALMLVGSGAFGSDNPHRTFQLKDLKKITAKANGHAMHLWVMDTPKKRDEGMMWLTNKEVRDNEGMVFVFPRADALFFWMHNTILPLDIIYLGYKNKVLNVQHGKAQDDTSLPSAGFSDRVVELKAGMAKKLGIKEGTVFSMPPLKATE